MMDKRHIDLCSGLGGFALAAQANGYRTIVFCEIDEFCQRLLARRFEGVFIEADIFRMDGGGYRGAGLLTAGFPCQPFSCAGKRKGTGDSRHIWPEVNRIIREAKPLYVLLENVPGLLSIEGGGGIRAGVC